MRTLLMFLAVAVVLALVSGVSATVALRGDAKARLASSKAEQAAAWARWRDAVQADQREWEGDPLLAPRDGGDAAPLLSAHVRWESLDGGRTPAGVPPLPEGVVEALRAWGEDWPGHAGDADAGLDDVPLGWMGELATYGTWNPEGPGSPLAGAPLGPPGGPEPYYLDAVHLARVRLLQGLRSGQPAAAARDVRELARLMLTTEHLVGVMVGVSLLGIERKAHEAAGARGLDLAGWEPVPKDRQDALRRALWVASAPSSLLASGDQAEASLAVGACAGLRESLESAHALRGYAEPLLPERYAALDAALAASPCRLERVRRAWSSKASAGQLPVSGQVLCQVPPRDPLLCWPHPLGRLPPMRDFLGARVVERLDRDPFKPYRER